jgi:hypothetical protein
MSMSDDEAPPPGRDENDIPLEPAPDLPPLVPELGEHVDALHRLPAPAFPITGTALRSRLKRAANAALSVVGLSQRRFNETVAEALTLLLAETRGLRGWLEERAPLLPSGPDLAAALDGLRSVVESLRAGVGALRQDVAHLRERLAAGIDATRVVDRRQAELADRVAALESRGGATDEERQARLEEVVRVLGQVGLEVQALRATGQDYERWFHTLERKYEGLSLEARAIVEDRSTTLPAPRVVDPADYARRVAAMSDGVRVNLGCGELAWPDYVNVDLRALPGVDVVADVRH